MGTPKGTRPWNAGTSKGWVDKRGYRWVYVTENGRRRARREHRIIMERAWGRRLEPWEVVHHKNGDTKDNRLENLEVVEWDEHTVKHHTNARHPWEARKSMEAFALLREEVKSLRRTNADLLAALRRALPILASDHLPHADCPRTETPGWLCVYGAARAAIAKAEKEADSSTTDREMDALQDVDDWDTTHGPKGRSA